MNLCCASAWGMNQGSCVQHSEMCKLLDKLPTEQVSPEVVLAAVRHVEAVEVAPAVGGG